MLQTVNYPFFYTCFFYPKNYYTRKKFQLTSIKKSLLNRKRKINVDKALQPKIEIQQNLLVYFVELNAKKRKIEYGPECRVLRVGVLVSTLCYLYSDF